MTYAAPMVPLLQPLFFAALLSPSAHAAEGPAEEATAAAAHPEPAYHFADEIFAEIDALIAAYPGVIHREEIGRSVTGRPLYAFRVRAPGRPVEAKLLVLANLHALEWVPSEVALSILRSFVRTPPAGVEAWVIPVANPDGRARVEADLLAGRNTYRRGNQEKVDLNRDFAEKREATAIWRHVLPGYYQTSPAPLSQPESRAIDALAARERFDGALSFHAFGGYLYYPWAGDYSRPPDWATFQAVGDEMARAMTGRPYTVKQLSHWAFFFRGHGMELDHLYGRYGTLSYLVETTRSGLSPARPSEWKTYFRWYNPHDPSVDVEACTRMARSFAVQLAAGAWAAPVEVRHE